MRNSKLFGIGRAQTINCIKVGQFQDGMLNGYGQSICSNWYEEGKFANDCIRQGKRVYSDGKIEQGKWDSYGFLIEPLETSQLSYRLSD